MPQIPRVSILTCEAITEAEHLAISTRADPRLVAAIRKARKLARRTDNGAALGALVARRGPDDDEYHELMAVIEARQTRTRRLAAMGLGEAAD